MTVPLIKCGLININIVDALFKKINRGLFLLNIADLSTQYYLNKETLSIISGAKINLFYT